MRKLVDPKTFGRPTIGLALFGCTNRPFYRISVFPDKSLGRKYEGNIIEQVGVYDPLPNERNEKLVSLNIHRIKYWIGERNAHVTVSALELLGLAGLLPLHPRTYIRADQNRKQIQLLRDKFKPKEVEEPASSSEIDQKSNVAVSSSEQVDEQKRAVA